jgi:hypothetical protein
MGNELLTLDDIQECRIASNLADGISAHIFLVDNEPMLAVCAGDWVIPRDLFISMWFWVLLDGKPWLKWIDKEENNNMLIKLNPEKSEEINKLKKNQKGREWYWRVLNCCHVDLTKMAKRNDWDIQHNGKILARLIDDWAELRIQNRIESIE